MSRCPWGVELLAAFAQGVEQVGREELVVVGRVAAHLAGDGVDDDRPGAAGLGGVAAADRHLVGESGRALAGVHDEFGGAGLTLGDRGRLLFGLAGRQLGGGGGSGLDCVSGGPGDTRVRQLLVEMDDEVAAEDRHALMDPGEPDVPGALRVDHDVPGLQFVPVGDAGRRGVGEGGGAGGGHHGRGRGAGGGRGGVSRPRGGAREGRAREAGGGRRHGDSDRHVTYVRSTH